MTNKVVDKYKRNRKVLYEFPFIGSRCRVIIYQNNNSNGMEEENKNNRADIKTPELSRSENKGLQTSLNEKYLEENEALYKKFAKETAGANGYCPLDSGYVVKTDDKKLLSLGKYTIETQASAADLLNMIRLIKKMKRLLNCLVYLKIISILM